MADSDRASGYVTKTPDGFALTDFKGNVIGNGYLVNCTRIEPGRPGSWISSKRCSYRFKIGDAWFAGRGYGESMGINVRKMKRAPPKRDLFYERIRAGFNR